MSVQCDEISLVKLKDEERLKEIFEDEEAREQVDLVAQEAGNVRRGEGVVQVGCWPESFQFGSLRRV